MHNFKKAIIALDGSSSKITDKNILINTRYALSSLGIPFEVYKPHTEGFKKLYEDMNQEDTLYILNDSLQYHLCEKPHILVCRSAPWVQATPKPTTIGIFTQEMLMGSEASQLIACIAKNAPVRQHYNLSRATTYILVNDYQVMETHTLGRYGLAAYSWSKLCTMDIHASVLLHQADGWPMLNKMLTEGSSCFSHPDDILIITNRDICLVPEATGIIRAHMDTHNLDACYAKRVDLHTDGLLGYCSLIGRKNHAGIDLFAFRPNASCINRLVEIPLMLGRVAWDNIWADEIKNKLPYNVCYHLPHDGDWQDTKGEEGNRFNLQSISTHSLPHNIGVEHYEGYFADVK
jgi:hypothetical protein